MTQTTMEQTLSNGWPKRFIITVTAYDITRVWEAGTRFILTLLAVVEVLKTTLTYCSDGRVRVTFIVDTVLVVMLTEVISRWFTGGDWRQFAILGGILITLGLIRILAVRYSPAPTGFTKQTSQPGPSFP